MTKQIIAYRGFDNLQAFKQITEKLFTRRTYHSFQFKQNKTLDTDTMEIWLNELIKAGVNLEKLVFNPPLEPELQTILDNTNKIVITFPENITKKQLKSLPKYLNIDLSKKPYTFKIYSDTKEFFVRDFVKQLPKLKLTIPDLSITEPSVYNERLQKHKKLIEISSETDRLNQSWFLERMKAIGYPNITDGHCLGLANMGKQAFAADEIDVFKNRLKKISKIPMDYFKNNFEKSWLNVKQYQTMAQKLREKANSLSLSDFKSSLINEAKKWELKAESLKNDIVDINAFFDGVALTQNPINYPEIIEPGEKTKENIQITLPIISPVTLDIAEKKITDVFSSVGSYKREDLATYLSLLAQHADNIPFSLVINSGLHAINLNYDPKNHRWILIDANFDVDLYDGPLKIFNLNNFLGLAQQIQTCLSDKEHIALNLTTTQNDAMTLINKMLQMTQTDEWQVLHPDAPLKDDAYTVARSQISHVNTQLLKFLTFKQLSHLLAYYINSSKILPDEGLLLVLDNTLLNFDEKSSLADTCIKKIQSPSASLLLEIADKNPAVLDKLIGKIQSPSASLLLEIADKNPAVLDKLIGKIQSPPASLLLEIADKNPAVLDKLIEKIESPSESFLSMIFKKNPKLFKIIHDKLPKISLAPENQPLKHQMDEKTYHQIIQALEASINSLSSLSTGYESKKNLLTKIKEKLSQENSTDEIVELLKEFAITANQARLTKSSPHSFKILKEELKKIQNLSTQYNQIIDAIESPKNQKKS